jgi:hypothetical protein
MLSAGRRLIHSFALFVQLFDMEERLMLRYTLLTLTFASAFFGCGTSSTKSTDEKKPATRETKPEEDSDATKKPAVSASRIAEGKYFVSAASVEAFDNLGNKLDPQTLQITGEYTWVVRPLGEEKYEVTATGSAKFSNSNTILVEINCRGAQDVYTFTLLNSNVLRDVKVIESGCPQGLKDVSSMQMSLEPLGSSAFVYTVAQQSGGGRVIETYTFRKS